jgi:Zn-dependent protease/CBS domain-containing protein
MNMGWSTKFARIAGIDLYVHATFPLLFIWVGFIYWVQTGTFAGILLGMAFIAVLFVCVVLHEYGHALTARHYGIGTRHITLLPIGGVAMLERMPKDPGQEIVVALMGPAVNVAIAAVLFVIIGLSGAAGEVMAPTFLPVNFLQSVLYANIFLAVFNMLPAFPMDGGRVLRAALSYRVGRFRATQLAARIGQGLALVLGIMGLFGNPFLILIAVFVWIGAAAEAGASEVETRLDRRPVAQAMITEFQTLTPEAPLAQAVELTLTGTQKDFPVLDGGRLVGVANQSAILRGLRDHGLNGQVGQIMVPPVTAGPDAELAALLENLQQEEVRLICILSHGRLVGFVDLDNISEFLRIQAALSER